MILDLLFSIIDISSYVFEYFIDHENTLTFQKSALLPVEEVTSNSSSINGTSQLKVTNNFWNSFKTMCVDLYNFFTQSSNKTSSQTVSKDLYENLKEENENLIAQVNNLNDQLGDLLTRNTKLLKEYALQHEQHQLEVYRLKKEILESTKRLKAIETCFNELSSVTGVQDPNKIVTYAKVTIKLVEEQGNELAKLKDKKFRI
jgi:hypothetical protein